MKNEMVNCLPTQQYPACTCIVIPVFSVFFSVFLIYSRGLLRVSSQVAPDYSGKHC